MSRRVRLLFEVDVGDGDDVDCIGDALEKVGDVMIELDVHDLTAGGGADELTGAIDDIFVRASVSRP